MLVGGLEKEADILEVIADLSNEEVFTPPAVVGRVLDLLPAEVWTNPALRWLDPGCKTGVFLREITRRLMAGLADAIPEEAERLAHILQDQVFGIAMTELTSLISRRSLYLSKDARSDRSVVTMPMSPGNVWFANINHAYKKGHCTECGASKEQMEQPGRDNYAYGFIHAAGRAAIAEEFEMRFDVIVGNPPYQMDNDTGNRPMPLYNRFVEQSKALRPQYITMIIQSRWMAGGLGLTSFRDEMLTDARTREIVDFPDSTDLFPGTVKVMGGVCYFLWERDNPGPCRTTLWREGSVHGPVERNLDEFDIFVRDSRAIPILHKVLAGKEPALFDLISSDKEFGLTSNFSDYSLAEFDGAVPLYIYQDKARGVVWVDRAKIRKSDDLIDTWKVLIPAAGFESQILPTLVLSSLRRAPNPSVCTQTYLFIPTTTEAEGDSVESYVRTRFVRFLVWLRKVSQHATRSTYKWVPQQAWDHEWTDTELYEKYDITQDEQAYLEEMIREMN